ncbi:hypothetical protein Tco_0753455 [Tanacetum coccineum]
MCKEDVLAELDAIKATVDIIDKGKGEVSTSCLEKELDLVKDIIAMLEKCFKLRYQDTSEDSVKQVCYKQHDFHCSKSDSAISDVVHQEVASEKGTGLGSVGFNDMLDPRFKDHQLNDNVPKGLVFVSFDDMLDPVSKDHLLNGNVPKGLVKPVDMMCGEDNILDDKLDETVAGGVIVDRAMLQASPPPNAMEYQEPHPTDKVDAAVFVDVQVDRVQSPKNPSLIDNVEGKKIDSSELNCVNINLPRSSEQIFKRLKRVTRKGKFEPPPYTPLPSTTPILKKRQSNRLKMNAIPMDNLDDDCQIIPLKYWLEDSRPLARTRKRNHKGYVKEPNTIVDSLDLPKIAVDPWLEDLLRPPNSHNRKDTLPAYFDNIFHLPTKTTHIFPWSKTGHSVDRDFWLTLLGCSKRGWLSDKHLDIWSDLMWKFRQPDADWAIAGPYLCAFVIRGDVPFWPANGVKYHVPWTEVDRMLSVSTNHDPIYVGLAYREHMVDYLWKYMIPEQRFKSIAKCG